MPNEDSVDYSAGPPAVWTIKPVDGVATFYEGGVRVPDTALAEAMLAWKSPFHAAIEDNRAPINIVPPSGEVGISVINKPFVRNPLLAGVPISFRGKRLGLTGADGCVVTTADNVGRLSKMRFLRNKPSGIDGEGRIVRLGIDGESGQFVHPYVLPLEEIPAAFEEGYIVAYEGRIELPEADPAEIPETLRRLEEIAGRNECVELKLSSGGVFLPSGNELVLRNGRLAAEPPIIPRQAREYSVAVSVDDLDLGTGRPLGEQYGSAEEFLARAAGEKIHLADWGATPSSVGRMIRSYAEAARRNGALFNLGIFTHGTPNVFLLAPDSSGSNLLYKADLRNLVGPGIKGVSVVVNACHAELDPYNYGHGGRLPENAIGFFAGGLEEAAYGNTFPQYLWQEMGARGMREFIGDTSGEIRETRFEEAYEGMGFQWLLGEKRPTAYLYEPSAFSPVVARSEGFDPRAFCEN